MLLSASSTSRLRLCAAGVAALAGGTVAAATSLAASPGKLPTVVLYENGKARSARCRWLLQEAGVPFEAIQTRPHAPNVLAINPTGKLPIAQVNGQTVTESTAICTHLADLIRLNGGAELIAPPGTPERAQHERWISFTLSELDAWKWHSFVMERVVPEGEGVAAIASLNDKMWSTSVRKVVEPHLQEHDYLVGDTFSCADIVMAWSLNWGRRSGLLEGEETRATKAYLARVTSRPHCALATE